jgi:tetratricopeptide (TPR) repeat protein
VTAIGLSRGRSPRDELETLCASGLYGDALEWYRAHDDESLHAPAARLLAATAAARVGEYEYAQSLGDAVLGALDPTDAVAERIRTLSLLGGVAFERGRLDEAEARYREVAALARQAGDQAALARVWNNLANIAHLRGEEVAAVELYLLALDVFERSGDTRGAAQAHTNLGQAYAGLGDRQEAERHATAAVILAGRASDPPLHALTFLSRAELLMRFGDLTGASRDLRDGYALATRSGDRYGAAEAHRLQALLALRRGNYQVAQAQAVLGYRRARELGARVLAVECQAALARALRALGQTEEAEACLAEVRHALEQLRAHSVLERVEREWSAAVLS